ncbi:UDP-GlcNAc:polypeptide N-acetylglucosaminyltransferase [Trypanosoma grayi]|uniref:UDP-GlcNAc:polypeptide N-acetylglucosaminyltransferase n=1 Tax=Trypanosoma grayi TaxID=71804 RepID=UPI0004F4646C|nr:UDP-GlcNAc:polypeptide N-acetylglucosaminyltransferase [Trypanosoma grayi]KEG12146.1 UDP-GlcNAc:polypeptide N-acetylglucosaminyltransferase [Trypanosoma grayi]
MDRRRYHGPAGGHRTRARITIALICFASVGIISLVALMLSVLVPSPPPQAAQSPTDTKEGPQLRAVELPAAMVPVDEATIFVSIAAFRDNECVTTLESLLTRSKNQHRVFLGISEERHPTDKSCLEAPHVLNRFALTHTRTMRWKDVVPAAFVSRDSHATPVYTPLLHARRDDDVITCIQSSDAAADESRQPGLHPLSGCRIVSRLGNPDDARGPTYGRYLTSLLYNNQDYYMVVDSHSRFVPGWDVKMIERARLMPTRGVMSHYPNGYVPENPDGEADKKFVMSMCKGVILPNNIPKLGARWIPLQSSPKLQGFVAAGYIFGDAQFVKDVPFDPYLPYLFDGEEILYSARLWTNGWDSYSPGDAFLYHNYARKDAPRFWSVMQGGDVHGGRMLQQRTAIRRALYLLKRRELNTTRFIVSEEEAHSLKPEIGCDDQYFGAGKVRSLDDYWRFTQLSDEYVKEKDNEGRWMGGEGLCN